MRLQQGDRVVMYGTVRKVRDDIITVDLDGSGTPAIVRSGGVVIEKILSDGSDWLHCLCNNNPSMDGFASCLADGTPVEPTVEGQWEGKLYVCLRCGRVIDQTTLTVTMHADVDKVILELDP